MRLLTACPLGWHHCTALHDRLATDDADECAMLGLTPLQALASGAIMGFAQAVIRRDASVAGAFGYTPEGTIWSLWTALSRMESVQVLRETPRWVAELLERAGKPFLYNYVPTSSERTLKWLKATGVFAVDPHVSQLGGVPVHYFQTTLRPLAPQETRSPCVLPS